MGGEKALVYSDPPYGVSIVCTDKAKGSIGFGGALGFVGADGIVAVNAYAPIIGDDTTDTAEKFYKLCLEIGMKDFILWGGNYFTAFLPPSPCWLIWDKREEIPSNNFADCEIAWASFTKPSRIYRQLWSGLLRKGDRQFEGLRREHPTQKPVELQTKIMTDFPSDIYFDGFLGSGSFMVAAQNVGKKMYGIEKSIDYCAVILERMNTAFPDLQIERL
jgi:site-specific DNA-methyltransferase (adenine-specific)